MAPLPGRGLVLCRGDLVAVVGEGAAPAVQAVLDLLVPLADEHVDVLSRAVVGHLAAASAPPPALGVVVLHDGGGRLLLHGAVVATVRSAAADQRHDGRDAALCVDAALPPHVTGVTVAVEGTETGAPPAWARLVDGRVPGGGAMVVPPGAAEAGPGASQVETPAPEPAAVLAPVLVDGVECNLGHFNHPFALRCATCQASLVAATRHTVKGPRPPLGTVAFDDGVRYELDADYVVGREPAGDPAVAAGEARPLPLDDPEQAVSRVHAEIRLQEWDVVVVDRGSANGVHLLAPEGTEWRRVGTGESVVISPGTQVAFGRRVMTYEPPD